MAPRESSSEAPKERRRAPVQGSARPNERTTRAARGPEAKARAAAEGERASGSRSATRAKREGRAAPAAARARPGDDRPLYPPSPRPLPEAVRADSSYKLRVVLVLAALALFLALYLALVAGSAYLVYWLYELPIPAGKDSGQVLVLKIGAMAGTGMLFLFLLKGLFKGQPVETEHYLPLSERDAPDLFAFVRELCRESGAPFPNRIFLSHDVNAAVFYPRSLLTLVLPARKNLLIGLGLLNAVNLSELKAILAHEFGHFAQSSMKLGQYVYVANRVVADMVAGRDSWDTALAHWRSIDLRLSFPAWILTAVVWLLRKLLGLVFMLINLLNLSLSRQMEFNADLHAVRLTGSDALISGLWKLERWELALQLACSDLASMAHHRRYSDDLFHHQAAALPRLTALVKKEPPRDPEQEAARRTLLTDYRLGPELQFPPSDQEKETLWHSHPPSHLREQNAKRDYAPLPLDERPSWLLLPAGALRAEVTRLAYQAIVGKTPARDRLEPADEVQASIDEEHAEVRQADHYHGYYDGRVVRPGDVDAHAAELDAERAAGTLDAARLRRRAGQFSSERLAKAMRQYEQRQEELMLLEAIGAGVLEPKGKRFEFRGEQQPVSMAKRLEVRVGKELDTLRDNFAKADEAFFRCFYSLADEERQRAELLERYRFLLAIQEHVQRLGAQEARLGPILQALQSGQELEPSDFAAVFEVFAQAQRALSEVARACEEVRLPKLANLEQGASVASFAFPTRVVRPPRKGQLEGAWIGQLLEQLDGGAGKLRKLHFKNLGALLRLQEELDPTLFPKDGATGEEAAEASEEEAE